MTQVSRALVLVIDDSDDQRALLRTQFERAGCEVIAAESGAAAEDALAGRSPQIIVIDLLMPPPDGWAVAERMRLRAPEAALVITSVLDTHDYPQADAVLPKPFTGEQVRRIVADLSTQGAR
ncbi:response regulator [Rathayibacter sp. YIM 133350]|uniref:response regulator n=1 Tax=Rathayibacter sp. YIM 133350 TaxID=3131992 RepID=UPI00307F1F3B